MNSYQEEDQLEEIPEYTRSSKSKTPKMSHQRQNESSIHTMQSNTKSGSKSKLNNLNGSPSTESHILWNEELKKLKMSQPVLINDHETKNKKI